MWFENVYSKNVVHETRRRQMHKNMDCQHNVFLSF